MLNLFLSCFILSIYIPIVAGLDLTRSYQNGPVALSSSASLFYEVNTTIDIARFALLINDSEVAIDGSAWVGLGIGEPTSGSMIGADIVTAQFAPGATNSCSIVDRYVPFVAFPWDEAPSIFPLPDDCAEPDWTLISCQRDASGAVLLEIDRPLTVKDDKQDRAILPGDSAVLNAYGGDFGYHNSNRESIAVTLYDANKNKDDHDTLIDRKKVPNDVDGFFDIRATNYSIPTKLTTYACTSIRIPLPPGKDHMIIGGEPLIEDKDDSPVHHFTLYLCKGEEYYNATKNTDACEGEPLLGPIGNPNATCSTFVFVYTKGISTIFYPANVGILIGSRPFLVMETHFNNPDGARDMVDASGIRVYYTSTIREHRAASLLLGDPFVTRRPKVIKSGFRYQNTCPSACTLRFSQPVYLYSSLLHMHTTGRQIYNNIYDENNTFVKTVNKVNFWSDRFQRVRIFDDPILLHPGQQMQSVCEYDTSKRPNTRFGIATKDEMCMEFLMYWPVQTDPKTGHEINICSYADFGGKHPITLCGDNGRLQEMISKETASKFPSVQNPSFSDTEGASTKFGTTGDACANKDGATKEASAKAKEPFSASLPLFLWL